MDDKEIKLCLKLAKTHVKNKNFKECLKECKNILKNDKSVYHAWVFVGIATEGLDQIDQASIAYKKAIEIDNEQVLAWQGLCNILEKEDKCDSNNELLTVYSTLIKLNQSNAEKKLFYAEKLAELHLKLNEPLKSLQCFYGLLKNSDDSKTLLLWLKIKEIIEEFENKNKLNENLSQIKLELYEFLSKSSEVDQLHFKVYIEMLLQLPTPDFKLIKQICEQMSLSFPRNDYPWRILSLVHLNGQCCEILEVDHEFPIIDKDKVLTALMELCPSSGYVHYLTGLNINLSIFERKEHFLKGVKMDPSAEACILLADCFVKLHDYTRVLHSVTQAELFLKANNLEKIHSKTLEEVLLLLKLRALVYSGKDAHLKEANQIINQLNPIYCSSIPFLLIIGYYYLKNNQLVEAKSIINQLTSKTSSPAVYELEGEWSLKNKDFEKSKQCFYLSLERNSQSSNALFFLGKILFYEDKNQSVPLLLKSAKIDPFRSATFFYLGLYYYESNQDYKRAGNCFKKALDLDSENEDAGRYLVATKEQLGENEDVHSILNKLTKSSDVGSYKWAWLKLGLYQIKSCDYSTSVTSLQNALRADPKDSQVWECLGEAYMKRGSYSTALKAFNHAIELKPEMIYCIFQTAVIKQTLGFYTEALITYQDILEKQKNYVPALMGLGTTYLHMVREQINLFADSRAISYCQSGVDALTQACMIRHDMSCLWKLLGDLFISIHVLPDNMCRLSISSKLVNFSDESGQQILLGRLDILKLASRCYSLAIHCCPKVSALWHDLGISFYHQVLVMSNKADDKHKRLTTARNCLKAFENALLLDALDHNLWNSFGNACLLQDINHKALAQHCFLKSIQLEPSNVVAWTNLGTLYFTNENLEISHKVFRVSQSLDPLYTQCWIGQSFIAETIGHSEAMDLFRHTTSLQYHAEGILGYSAMVCSTLKSKDKQSYLYDNSIVKMDAITVATDSLSEYCFRYVDDFSAHNMLGILFESQNLLKSAKSAYENAMACISEDGNQLNLIKFNYARTKIKLREHQDAIQIYLSATKQLSIYELAQQALCFYLDDKLDFSYEAYEKALQNTQNKDFISQLNSILGLLSYKSNKIELAQSHLLKSFQTKSLAKEVFCALYAFGIHSNTFSLCLTAVREFKPQTVNEKVANVWLTTALSIRENKITDAYESVLHAYETIQDPSLSYLLFYLVLSYPLSDKISFIINLPNIQYIQQNFKQDLHSMLLLHSGNHGPCNLKESPLSSTQKAVHINPTSSSNWCSLLAAIQAENTLRIAGLSTKLNQLMTSTLTSLTTWLISIVEEQLSNGLDSRENLQNLHLWCVQLHSFALLTAGKINQVKDFVNQVIWLYDEDPVLLSIIGLLENKFENMQLAALKDKSTFSAMVFFTNLIYSKCYKESEENLQECYSNATSFNKKLFSTFLAILAFKQLMGCKNDKNSKKIFEVHTDDTTPFDIFMKASIALKNLNMSLFKKYLSKLINCTVDEVYLKSIAREELLTIYKENGNQDELSKLLKEASDDSDIRVLKLFQDVNKKVLS